ESNGALVALARRRAAEAGLAERAAFHQGDLFALDLAPATVITLFLTPDLLLRLRPSLAALAPGTRLVSNTWTIPGWPADHLETLDEVIGGWRNALLWIVPARVEGGWRADDGVTLALTQRFQQVEGTARAADGAGEPLADVELRGEALSFRAGDARYELRAGADVLAGTVLRAGTTRPWRAARIP
ncbi:MAG TPA: hypothetical protein VHE35_33675, partial [Kofleriaceae bacterium]|nr:hypothetical protein [Kofleriaceae bacterium]